MNDYRPKDLAQDTRQYLDSQLGQFHMSTFNEMAEGFLSAAADMTQEHPERYLAKYSALKEVMDSIKQPLDDDQRAGG